MRSPGAAGPHQGPFVDKGGVVAEALAFSIGDSMGHAGKTRWLRVSMLLGREFSLFF